MEEDKKRLRDIIHPGLHKVPETTIRVMQYNIKFLGGPEEEDEHFLKHRDKSEIIHYGHSIAHLAAYYNVDILMLNEVDFDSSRSHYMNQSSLIADKLEEITGDYFHRAEARNIVFDESTFSWSRWARQGKKAHNRLRKMKRNKKLSKIVDFLLFADAELPEDPVKLSFGNATLSRFPITKSQNHFYTKRDWLSQLKLWSLKDEQKSFLECQIDYLPSVEHKVPLYVINTHLDARNDELRRNQARRLVKHIGKRQKGLTILGGDLNANPCPPELELDKKGHDDSIEQLARSKYLKRHPSVDPANWQRDADNQLIMPVDQMTYASKNPFEMIDFIFVSPHLQYQDYRALPDPFSDHRAVYAEIKMPADLVREKRRDVLRDILEGQ